MSSSVNKIFKKKLTDLVKLTVGGGICFCGISLYLENEKFYNNILMPFFHKLDPETAHNLAVQAAKYKVVPEAKLKQSKILETSVFGLRFKSPIGLAAGFDKNGVAVEGMSKLGFSFIEVGSVTPIPQPGNKKPRVHRLVEDKAVINSYGFNSDGHDAVYNNLSKLPMANERDFILGINLGKNKTSTDPVSDYINGVKKFASIADYLVINVSSPNTPGLRDLQHENELKLLISSVMSTRNSLPEDSRPPVLLKIAPDLTLEDKKNISQIVMDKKFKVDGLIVSNTTISRPSTLVSSSDLTSHPGGLSGEPLKDMSTSTVRDMALFTRGTIPIIGVGGVSSGEDAYDKIKNGATLVQLYTALVYNGPKLTENITNKLEELLINDGYTSVNKAVGADLNDKK